MKRLFALALASALGLCPASAQFVQSPPFGAGQVPGTTTNDSASAGKVGEIVKVSPDFSTATVTISNGANAVVTWTGHPYALNTASGVVTAGVINFTTTGGLPTGLSVSTNYYAVPIDANTLHVATSVTNALAGTFITTSSAGSGTHTGKAQLILTNSTAADWGGAALTAGDWDCTGSAGAISAGSAPSSLVGWIGATTASQTGSLAAATGFTIATTLTIGLEQFTLGTSQVLNSATTNIFFSMSSTFAGTSNGFGIGRCRRAR